MELTPAVADGAAAVTNGPARHVSQIRSLLETPILDERKWSKVPELAADAVFVDLEDSVAPGQKDAARARALEYLATPDFFRGKLVVVRPNHLSTPWGHDDLTALASVDVSYLAYPKLQAPDDLDAVRRYFSADRSPAIFGIVETAGAVLEADRLAACPDVVALIFGAGDLSVDLGIPLYTDGGSLNPAFRSAKVRTVLAANAFGCLPIDSLFGPDVRDSEDIRRRLVESRNLGFRAAATFYAPHAQLVNEAFSPSEDALAKALDIISVYEQALAKGEAAVRIEGRAVLVHDYEKALAVRVKHADSCVGTPSSATASVGRNSSSLRADT